MNIKKKVNYIYYMKIYRIKFDENDLETGVYAISLVEDPANGYKAISLSSNKEHISLKTLNEERRIVVGVVLEPYQLIDRNFGDGPSQIYFDRETILLGSQQFMKRGYAGKSTIDHDGKFIDGVTFTESWIVEDPIHDKSKLYGFDSVPGTWMVTMKIWNDEVWNDYVKTGKITGFSIDSIFELEEVDENTYLEDKNKNKITMKSEFKNVFKRFLLKKYNVFLGSITLDDETVIYFDGEVLEVGTMVFSDDALTMPIVDAELKSEGKVIKTDAEGKVADIAEDVAPADAPTEDVQMSAVKAILEKLELETIDELVQVVDEMVTEAQTIVEEAQPEEDPAALKEKIAELEAIIADLQSQIEGVKAENVQMKKTIPATQSIKKTVAMQDVKPAGKESLMDLLLKMKK